MIPIIPCRSMPVNEKARWMSVFWCIYFIHSRKPYNAIFDDAILRHPNRY